MVPGRVSNVYNVRTIAGSGARYEAKGVSTGRVWRAVEAAAAERIPKQLVFRFFFLFLFLFFGKSRYGQGKRKKKIEQVFAAYATTASDAHAGSPKTSITPREGVRIGDDSAIGAQGSVGGGVARALPRSQRDRVLRSGR